SVTLRICQSKKLARFDRKDFLKELEVAVAGKSERWIDVELNHDFPEDTLLWICVDKQPGIYWGYSKQEVFGSRFAIRFEGELKPRPSHGLARIAPVTDDWFPINHHGRLPGELHEWMEKTIGIKYDRKVRATLCCRVTPDAYPYRANNVINGISRAEDWPNIWISDPATTFPQDITLEWDKVQTISQVYLTFDTDLCAPDRCFGFPREEYRFVFPVP
ncbi:MAG: hypothetical protein KJT03_08540, partial [Verrucomicrobiae bacterium]|nr:hypothetical protein [Verrucomicrobiae bacterium]